jgi:hypothetical protein
MDGEGPSKSFRICVAVLLLSIILSLFAVNLHLKDIGRDVALLRQAVEGKAGTTGDGISK